MALGHRPGSSSCHLDGAPGHDPLNDHGCGSEAIAAGETGEMGAAGAEDFSAERAGEVGMTWTWTKGRKMASVGLKRN